MGTVRVMCAERAVRELPDHVRHHVQSAATTASCHTHKDRLEQDSGLQDRQRTEELTLPSPCLCRLIPWGRLADSWGGCSRVCPFCRWLHS